MVTYASDKRIVEIVKFASNSEFCVKVTVLEANVKDFAPLLAFAPAASPCDERRRGKRKQGGLPPGCLFGILSGCFARCHKGVNWAVSFWDFWGRFL